MLILLLVIMVCAAIVIGIVMVIGNQKSGLRKMDDMQRSLDDINQKLREMKGYRL